MSAPAFTPAHFADLMAELPAAVAVVTTTGPDGPMGLAVTSMTAYTADPPSIMCSVAHTSRCCEHLLGAERFGVHLLHNGQESIAKTFASKSDYKFAALEWSWDADVPQIHGALAYMRCEREATFTHLDHTVLIGRIIDVERATDADPMLYLRRRFAWRLTD
jgi:flavin reductase (DIM6/NTAB) family NADH-FMN oxidoreductase RutF